MASPWFPSTPCLAPGAGMGLGLLGSSWVVINGVVSRETIAITHIGGLITPLITTHEPPSRGVGFPVKSAFFGGVQVASKEDIGAL